MATFLRRPAKADPPVRHGVIGYRHPALSRQRHTAIGVDVGAGLLKIVQIRWTRTGPRLENFALVPTPSGLLREGSITQPPELASLLTRIYAEMNLGQQQVGTTVGGPNVMTRQIALPTLLSPDELAEAMRFEAPQQLPIPAADLIYDYTMATDGAAGEQPSVFLAGIQKSVVEKIVQAFGQAGLRLQAIEMDTLALMRALDLLGLRPLDPAEPFALLDMGEQATRLTICHETLPVFTRSMPTGLMSLRLAISDATNMPPHQAEQELRRQGLLEGPLVTAVGPWMRSLLEAVTRALEFFLIQHRGLAVRRVYVVGGGAVLAGLVDHLSRDLTDAMYDRLPEGERLRVQPVGLESLDVNPAVIGAVAGLGPLLVHALGSALRGEVEA